MNDYIKEARRIVTGYFAALAPSEQLRRETAQELRQGHITEGYARELTLSANSEALKLRQNAQGQLDALARRFASSATAADTPDGNALQGGDYRLLAENFPMSVEEFSALCERNKNNPCCARPWSTATSTAAWLPMQRNTTALPVIARRCLTSSSGSALACWKQNLPAPPGGMPTGT